MGPAVRTVGVATPFTACISYYTPGCLICKGEPAEIDREAWQLQRS
jgi:hypothetical protein